MVTYDARPSSFTQLSTTSEWEYFHSCVGAKDAVDGPGAFTASFDVPGRNIVAAAGNAVIRGQLWRADASFSTAIPAASAQNRIDRLVLRLTRGATTSPTVVAPWIIQGSPSGSPVLPVLQRTPTGIWDLPICYWTSASSGALSALTDNRETILNDVWHTINTPGPFTGAVNYKMTPDRMVIFGGLIQLATSGSYNNVTIATMPPIYRPQGDKFIPIVSMSQSPDYGNSSTSPGIPRMHIGTDGTVKLEGFPGAINGGVCYIDGASYPLDF